MNKPLQRLKYLLDACASRDPRYQEAYGKALRAAGPILGDLPKHFDFSEWPDAELIYETHHHLQSMLVNCVTSTGHKPDLHMNLQMIESAIPVPKPKPRP